MLAPRFATEPALRARLLRESRLAAALEHPHVVPVHDAGEVDGRVYVVMRYVDGTDLRALLRDGPLAPDRAVEILDQLAQALDAAHEHGLVHRDVKPSNVLIDDHGNCYLTDFGLSEIIAEPGVASDGLQGSVDYIAPEQIRGDDVDGRADLYSLGAVLVQMLTGEVPYPRASEVATLFDHLQAPPPSVRERRPELPAEVDEVVAAALAKDPADRPRTGAELVERTRQALGIAAPGRRSRWVLALGIVAVLVVATVVTVVIGRAQTTPAPGPSGALVRIDASTGQVTGDVSVAGYPGAVAVSDGGVWLADFRLGALWRYSPDSAALQRITAPGEPRDLTAVGNHVYVVADGPDVLAGNIARYDAGTGVRTGAVPLRACAIGSGDGRVWAAGCPFVQQLSTGSGPLKVVSERLMPFADPLDATNHRVQLRDLTVGLGSVWVLGDGLDRRLWRLDESTGQAQDTVELPFAPQSVAVGGGLVWITDPIGDAVVPLDPATGTLLPAIPVGRGASGVAASSSAVWVASSLDGTVSEIDPVNRQVTATIAVGGTPVDLAAADGAVWVSTQGSS